MKVLFAVSSESISDAIIKKYQKDYKEIISYKKVYYFNAILKEIQKDKTYDRIVISEDLEPFSNNNYDAIDKFIFEKLDNISDEAQDIDGNETSIILICTDRHTKGSAFLVKLFGIGIYNALLGSDRSMENVCKLINKPRVKKEAKINYKIDADDVNYSNKSEKEVSELEIQNILNHFKKLGKNQEKYTESFNNIAAQYTDEQLKIVINCLPMRVKAILEEESPKYQELMSVNGIIPNSISSTLKNKEDQEKTGIKIDIIENKSNQNKISGPIVIPSSVKISKNKGESSVKKAVNNIEIPTDKKEANKVRKIVKREEPVKETIQTRPVKSSVNVAKLEAKREKNIEQPAVKVKKVKPKSIDEVVSSNNLIKKENKILKKSEDIKQIKKVEPKKIATKMVNSKTIDDSKIKTKSKIEENVSLDEKKGRGRPKRETETLPFKETEKKKKINQTQDIDVVDEEFEDDLILPGMDENFEEEKVAKTKNIQIDEEDDLLPGMDDEYEEDEELLPGIDDEYEENEELLLGMDDEYEEDEELLPGIDDEYEEDEELLPGMDDEYEEDEELLPGMDDEYEEDEELLPGMDDEYEEDEELLPGIDDEYEEDEELLPGMDDEYEEDEELLPGMDEEYEEDEELLPEMDEEYEEDEDALTEIDDEEYAPEVELPGLDELDDEEDVLPGIDENDEDELLSSFEEDDIQPSNKKSNQIESIKPRVDYSMSSLNSLLTKDKKIVTFLGTTKNGTSFLVNNLAALFSSCGISTAILDMTKNKNSYYIYTNNEEELRNIAYNSISKLQKGFAEGIKVDQHLSVYTALPNDGKDYSDAESILSTLVQNHSLVLIDCDFDTDPAYFASCQEIYLVQSMDILTIQPLTAFLRDLKAKGVLESEKVRVVINKEINVKSLTTKAIIGGMSFYNDPSMSFMTELFNKDMVKACSIPFEDNAYSKYLDSMVNCNISIRGYSKAFMNKMRNLGDMVYPLVSKSTYGKTEPQANYGKKAFSSNMNNTLSQMRKKY